jgi:hypothetical protein
MRATFRCHPTIPSLHNHWRQLMRLNRIQQLGSLALFCGLVLVSDSSIPAAVSKQEMAGTFGGALCWRCKSIAGCDVEVACAADPDNRGKFFKQAKTNQAAAECAQDVQAGQGRTSCSTPDTPKLCETVTTCDNNACTVNCSSTTQTVPTNCPMSSSFCTGS